MYFYNYCSQLQYLNFQVGVRDQICIICIRACVHYLMRTYLNDFNCGVFWRDSVEPLHMMYRNFWTSHTLSLIKLRHRDFSGTCVLPQWDYAHILSWGSHFNWRLYYSHNITRIREMYNLTRLHYYNILIYHLSVQVYVAIQMIMWVFSKPKFDSFVNSHRHILLLHMLLTELVARML